MMHKHEVNNSSLPASSAQFVQVAEVFVPSSHTTSHTRAKTETIGRLQCIEAGSTTIKAKMPESRFR